MRKPGDGMTFLQEYGATRAGAYGDSPDFFGASVGEDGEDDGDAESGKPKREWNYETHLWQPIPVRMACRWHDPCLCPTRFVDGKDVGRTIAFVRSPQGFMVPIRVSQIGGIALRAVPGSDADSDGPPFSLRVESRQTDTVVSFMADLFPWNEVEQFGAALQANSFRLLISHQAGPKDDMRNLAWLNENARGRTREEMFRAEREMLQALPGDMIATITDGSLDHKKEGFSAFDPVMGIIKKHANTTLLHPPSWDTVYSLRHGERTPAIACPTEQLRDGIVTWYVRVGARTGGPLDGVVRVEINRPFFESVVGRKFEYINYLSVCLCRWRTRNSGYSRQETTLEPIRRAEELLGAAFRPRESLNSQFYRLTGL